MVSPEYKVPSAICQVSGGKAVVTTDVGQNQMWAAQFFRYTRPRTFISSGGLGTMGFGLPACIGAQFGRRDELAVCITGDGGVQMNFQELVVAVEHRLPIVVVILNNGYLGMVRQWQELFYDRRYSGVTLTGNPDFARLAEAHGATGLRCAGRAELRETIERALATDGPVLVDVPHWAAEWTWLPAAERVLEAAAADAGVRVGSTVSRIVTDPWVARY